MFQKGVMKSVGLPRPDVRQEMDEDQKKNEGQKYLEAAILDGSIKPGWVYRHYKGGYYTVFAVTVDEADQKIRVHYYSHERKTRWTRTFLNFVEMVTVDGKERLRFRADRIATDREMLVACGMEFFAQGMKSLQDGLRFAKGFTS